jgi:multidrug resistance protein MdtO
VAGASALAGALKPLGALFREELAPRPGRLTGAVRTAACCCLVTAVAMVFQIPSAYLAVYVVFMISREDVVATTVSGLTTTVAVTAAVALALVLAAFDVGSIVLRLPVMAIATFLAMYAARAFKLGPAAFLAGVVLVEAQTLVDQAPSTEDLVHAMLWLWVVVELPILVAVLAQLATGVAPAAVARRIGPAVLRTLATSLRRSGSGDLQEQHAQAEKLLVSTRRAGMVDATVKRQLGVDMKLIETLETLLSMRGVLPAETPAAARERLASECAACADAVERRTPVAPRTQPVVDDVTLTAAPAGVLPIVYAMAGALDRLRDGLDRLRRGVAEPPDRHARPPLIDRGDHRDNVRFAIKSTLAVMTAYMIYTGIADPGISTAVTTCFFVSLGSLGESRHKAILRISGALVGGLVAGLCIAFLRPSMMDIGQLSLLIAAATGVCAWIAASSVRLSYFGLQAAFAFLYGFLYDYAPPSHFKELFNRVVGILLGNVLVTFIFIVLWPTSASDRAGASIDQALRELAALLRAGAPPAGARLAVLEAGDKARGFEAYVKYELGVIPEAERPAPPHQTSLAELRRLTALTFVATEPLGSPAVADRVRRERERAAQLLLARTGAAGLEAGPGPQARAAVAESARTSDRAAVEAGALLLSELEKGHAVAS